MNFFEKLNSRRLLTDPRGVTFEGVSLLSPLGMPIERKTDENCRLVLVQIYTRAEEWLRGGTARTREAAGARRKTKRTEEVEYERLLLLGRREDDENG